MIEIRRILCPTDFSEFSRRALDHAIALAGWYEAEIAVVHVLPGAKVLPQLYPYLEPPVEIGPAARERALEELGRFVHRARARGITAEVALEEGQTVEGILKRARDLPADLLVMGTHGRGGFERWVLGSVTEKVLRKAPCPVLTVPPAAEGSAAPERVVFKKILCPIDFSPASVKSLEFALSLAEEADACLMLLHVVESVPEEEPRESIPFLVPEYRAHMQRQAAERLRAVVPEPGSGVNPRRL